MDCARQRDAHHVSLLADFSGAVTALLAGDRKC
jgi:hypothetical protein